MTAAVVAVAAAAAVAVALTVAVAVAVEQHCTYFYACDLPSYHDSGSGTGGNGTAL